MDDPALDPVEHARALQGLARINRISRAGAAMWEALRSLPVPAGRPLRVLDIACGGGDVARGIARRAAREARAVAITGCDLSDVALEIARRATTGAARISWMRLDALRDDLPAGHDAITCSLFLHHLDEDDVVALLARMRGAAGMAIVVDDLRRSRAGWWMAYAGTRLLTRSRVVHVDGPLSVEGAYTVSEARALAERAGLDGATVRQRPPGRFLLQWRRDG